MKINRCILLVVMLILPCSGATGVCNGVSYNKDIYRCEYGELIGKCKGKDYYAAYDKCVNGVVVSGTASSNNSGTSTGSRGTFTDSRDGKTYKWIQIGEQTWMAENLNYNVSGSKCYYDDPDYCKKYGRLYNWNAAMKVCPKGWHLPSDAEWRKLTLFVGGSATKLKSANGWYTGGSYIPGTDNYGFTALPGGHGTSNGNFYQHNFYGEWWKSSASEYDRDNIFYITYCDEYASSNHYAEGFLFSVRCVQD